ncbi:MAG: hypothetical protein WC758_02350 [Candidatus Woesearchaeota archaeon]|jgi:hypothetical protein
MNSIKIINLPRDETRFKIVQLYHDSNAIMLCGSLDLGIQNHHYKILENYLTENNIDFDKFAPHAAFPSLLMPTLETKDKYKVVGMGYAGIDRTRRYFQLPYSSNKEYNIAPDKKFQEILKEQFSKESPFWEELKKTNQMR